jgi:hypothetical protein
MVKIKKYLSSNKILPSSRISRVPFFHLFVLNKSTRYKNKCRGDLSEFQHTYARDHPQHAHNTAGTSTQKAKANRC